MPIKELERLQAVHRFLTLKISKEEELQEIVTLAAQICETPVALITLIDEDTQYVNFKVGTELDRINRNDSFCNHLIEQKDVLVVPDALNDTRFADNTFVKGNANVRFYAGSPLTTQDGHNLGSLCVIGMEVKELSHLQQQMLKLLSKQVIHILEFDFSLDVLKEQFIEAKSSEIKLRSFFESSSSSYLLIGKEFEILHFNKVLADFIYAIYNVEVVPGMIVTKYLHEAYIPDFVLNYNQALSGKSVAVERNLKFVEKEIWWYITYDPARNADGEIIGVSFNSKDITERKANEQKILSQNESLRKIAHIQSHELRKPVASIIGFMNMFKEDNYTSTPEDLKMMEKAVDDLDQKIRTIVSFSD